jgi:hypothetical protein
MKTAAAWVLLLSALTACTTTTDARNALQKWVGRSADEFVTTYGVPQSQYQLQSGDTLLAWGDSDSVYMPPQATTTGYVNPTTGYYTANTMTSGGGSIPLECAVQLTVGRDGTIKSYNIMKDSLGFWQLSRCSEIFK